MRVKSPSLCILKTERGVIRMYTIERLVDQGWAREISFKTEFKAFINARTKCMATGKTYRVINSDRTVVCVITLDDCKRQLRAR